MAIRFVTGKPGAGKTYYAVWLLAEELGNSENFVVTNIPLNLGELNAYLQKRFPDRSIDLHERVRVLDETETFEFYRYRSGGLELPASPDVSEVGGKVKKVPKDEFVRVMKEAFLAIGQGEDTGRPVTYFIDEAHNFFNAREYMNTGRGLLYYCSQHRHLHDNVLLITQALDNVEKQMRVLAQDYNVIRNGYQEKFWIFKRPGRFERESYWSQPTPSAVPYVKATFKLDCEGVGRCYNTTGALGVMERAEDKPRHIRGLPWWTIYLFGCLAVVGIIGALFGAQKGIVAAFGFTTKGTTEMLAGDAQPDVMAVEGSAVATAPAGQVAGVPAARQAGEQLTRPSAPAREKVWVKSMYVNQGQAKVWLTDGRVFTHQSEELEYVRAHGAKIDGEWFYRAPNG